MTQKQYMSGAERQAADEAELARLEQGTDQRAADTQTTEATPTDAVDWEKRYKDAQSYFTKQINELKSKVPAQDFETENEKLQRQVAELHNDLHARNVAEKVRDAQQQVGKAHPDFEAVISSNAFAEWIKAQPEVFQNAIYDEIPNADLAIKALSLFKMETRPASQGQPKADPASMAVRTSQREIPQELRGPKVWSMAEIQRMTPAQFAANEAEIDKAFAEGRIK